MDSETKELAEQRHRIDLLETKMEANMKTLRADNEVALTKHEAAIKQLQSSNEKVIGSLRGYGERHQFPYLEDDRHGKSIRRVHCDFSHKHQAFPSLCLRKLRGGFG